MFRSSPYPSLHRPTRHYLSWLLGLRILSRSLIALYLYLFCIICRRLLLGRSKFWVLRDPPSTSSIAIFWPFFVSLFRLASLFLHPYQRPQAKAIFWPCSSSSTLLRLCKQLLFNSALCGIAIHLQPLPITIISTMSHHKQSSGLNTISIRLASGLRFSCSQRHLSPLASSSSSLFSQRYMPSFDLAHHPYRRTCLSQGSLSSSSYDITWAVHLVFWFLSMKLYAWALDTICPTWSRNNHHSSLVP